MELILLRNVKNVGRKGEVVRVRDGYARNFLLPQKVALASTGANRAFVQEQQKRAEKRWGKEKAEAQERAQKLAEVCLAIEAKAGEKDKLFGAVTSTDIVEALKEKGFSFDKRQVHPKQPIRKLGKHEVVVELYPEVKQTITIEVVQKS